MTIEEAFVELEDYIDASDPDMDLVRSQNLVLLHSMDLNSYHVM